MRISTVLFLSLVLGCKGEEPADTEDPEACELPCQFSAASSGGLCQVNLFCDTTEPAVYCGEEADGTYTCDCGPAVDAPPSFSSDDFCELEGEARACAAMAQCGNWTFE